MLKAVWQAWQQSHLMLRILIGIIIGSVLAIVMPDMNAVSILGDLFVGALKAMAPVLVAVLVTLFLLFEPLAGLCRSPYFHA